MPRKHHDTTTQTVSEARLAPQTAEQSAFLQAATDRIISRLRAIDGEIRRLIPDYDGSNRAACKLAGVLSIRFPGEPLDDWHQMPIDELLGYIDAVVDTTRHDTKDDTPKKTRKKRAMNARAADCARRYRQDNGKTPLKTIVDDYVHEFGGSVATIMRVLNDNPDQWKDDTKTTF